ncbi:nitrous oxide reductase accessory protein NosL [Reinekea sp.]|jgi:copper chaperone NosL|uniref:nitrous oxide reductase accessory protein NosL n=1 Tax=Reinekea sp. TaxID=1970455 RepID=UPI0039893A28
MNRTALLPLIVLFSVFLAACSGNKETTNSAIQAAAIESSDQCHLCGMVIQNFPGPKGQLALKGDETTRKFCSNRDAFTYYLQPENQHRKQAIFVHDMSKTPWESPTNDHFIAAENAFYVYGSNRKAAMGIALASFSSMDSAHEFKAEFGGEMVKFEDITLELLAQDGMDGASMSMSH